MIYTKAVKPHMPFKLSKKQELAPISNENSEYYNTYIHPSNQKIKRQRYLKFVQLNQALHYNLT